jgi:23S rRNA pseudoU1915 N3-methylase RlmH
MNETTKNQEIDYAEKAHKKRRRTGYTFGPEDIIEEKCTLNIRKLHDESEEKQCSGMEKIKKEIPEITTLTEKANQGNFTEVLALAGVALKENKTAFSIMKKNIRKMRGFLQAAEGKLSTMEAQLVFLEELAVLDK